MMKTIFEYTVTLLKDRRFTQKKTMLMVSFLPYVCVLSMLQRLTWFLSLTLKTLN